MFKTKFASLNDRFGSNFNNYEVLKGEDGFSPIVEVVETENGNLVTITDKDGPDTFVIKNGKDGSDGYTPIKGVDYFDGKDGAQGPQGPQGERGEQGPQGKQGEQGPAGPMGPQGPEGPRGPQGPIGPQGLRGDKGEQGPVGQGFSISRTYSSVSLMHESFSTDGVPFNGFVLIETGNIDDVDNAKLYVKLESGYSYLTDLSGAQGIKGEKGDKGEQGPQGDQGIQGIQGEKGEKGDKGDKGDPGEGGNVEVATDDDILFLLTKYQIVDPITDGTGFLYLDKDQKILTM